MTYFVLFFFFSHTYTHWISSFQFCSYWFSWRKLAWELLVTSNTLTYPPYWITNSTKPFSRTTQIPMPSNPGIWYNRSFIVAALTSPRIGNRSLRMRRCRDLVAPLVQFPQIYQRIQLARRNLLRNKDANIVYMTFWIHMHSFWGVLDLELPSFSF